MLEDSDFLIKRRINWRSNSRMLLICFCSQALVYERRKLILVNTLSLFGIFASLNSSLIQLLAITLLLIIFLEI